MAKKESLRFGINGVLIDEAVNPAPSKKRFAPLYEAVERTMTTEYCRDEKTGRVSVINKVTSRKVSDRDKGLKVNDFGMDSLAAIGAVDGLKFSTYSDNNIERSLDNIDRFLDAVDAADAAAMNAKAAADVADDLGYDDLGY